MADWREDAGVLRMDMIERFRQQLAAHGPAVFAAAMTMAVAHMVHELEHYSGEERRREIIVGQFVSHFFAVLELTHETCAMQHAAPTDPMSIN